MRKSQEKDHLRRIKGKESQLAISKIGGKHGLYHDDDPNYQEEKIQNIKTKLTDFATIFTEISRGYMTEENMDQRIKDIVFASNINTNQLIKLAKKYCSTGERSVNELQPYIQSLVSNGKFTSEQKKMLSAYENKLTENEFQLGAWMIKFTTRDMSMKDRSSLLNILRGKTKHFMDYNKARRKK